MMFRNVLINGSNPTDKNNSNFVYNRLLSVAGFNFVFCISLPMYDYFQNSVFQKKKKSNFFCSVRTAIVDREAMKTKYKCYVPEQCRDRGI